MESKDINNLKILWDEITLLSPEVEALNIIPAGIRVDMIKCIQETLFSIGCNQINVSGEYSLFVTLLSIVSDFYKIENGIDPLEFAKSEYNRLYENVNIQWISSPIINIADYGEFNGKENEEFAIWERSGYFNAFLDEIKASSADELIIRKFVVALAEGKISDLPTRIPDCFVGNESGRLFMIYFFAAQTEWRQIQSLKHDNKIFYQITYFVVTAFKTLKKKYPEVISEWEWYWKDNHQEIFTLGSKMLLGKDLGIKPFDKAHFNKSFELLLMAILYWGIILKNWPDYLFSYLLPDTVKGVYSRMNFSRFLDLHPEGTTYKTIYSKYCINTGISPLIYLQQKLEEDSKGKGKLWISPSINKLNSKDTVLRYEIICRLFDILNEWGAFGEDIDTFSIKTLFSYRFTGVIPVREIEEKIPWKKSKTDLALLISVLLENYEGRPPFAIVNSFFNINKLNIAALIKQRDSSIIKKLVLKAFNA